MYIYIAKSPDPSSSDYNKPRRHSVMGRGGIIEGGFGVKLLCHEAEGCPIRFRVSGIPQPAHWTILDVGGGVG